MFTLPDVNASMKEWALFYSQHLNLAVVPVKSHNKIAVPLATSKNKKNGGFSAGITEETTIKEWWEDGHTYQGFNGKGRPGTWKSSKDYNIGLTTGQKSGGIVVVDLDIDKKKGKNGLQSLKRYAKDNGHEIPRSWKAKTGRGGYHLFFYTNKPLKNAVEILPGVDIRADGGGVVLAPSIHQNGNRYQWIREPGPTELSELPGWIRELVEDGGTKRKEPFSLPESLEAGNRNETLFKYACKLQGAGLPDELIKISVEAYNNTSVFPPLESDELEKIFQSLNRYPKGNPDIYDFEDGEASENLKPFHLYRTLKDGTQKLYDIYDKAIAEDIKKKNHLFVCGETPYFYNDGGYRVDLSGNKLRGLIKKHIFSHMLKSHVIERVYKLIINDYALEKSPDDLNAYPAHWINFKNGMYDTMTRELLPHSPKYLSINQIPHNYQGPDEDVGSGEKLEAYFSHFCKSPDDREMLLQYAGYCLTRDTRQQKFLILIGDGNTGKSTFLGLMAAMVGGENISNVSLDQLQQRFSSIDLQGKLLNSCGDLEVGRLEDTSTIKQLTGEDTIRGEHKGKRAITFNNYAKLLFSANEPPVIGEKSKGFFRRLLILKIDRYTGTPDPKLKSDLIGEMDYFIRLCVEAVGRMYENELITESKQSLEAVRQIRGDSDTVQAFIDDVCSTKSTQTMDRVELYNHYTDYCDSYERQYVTRNNFYKSLRIKGFTEKRTSSMRYFSGLAWIGGDDDI